MENKIRSPDKRKIEGSIRENAPSVNMYLIKIHLYKL